MRNPEFMHSPIEQDVPSDKFASNEEKPVKRERKSRQRFPRVAAAAFSFFPSFSPGNYAEQGTAHAEQEKTVEHTDENATGGGETAAEDVEVGEESIRIVEWKGKSYDASEFNDELMAGFQELLGSYAEKCDDAEQCYYYYGDQLETDVAPIAALTGKSAEELKWVGGTIRQGFAQHNIGSNISGVVEVGRDVELFPRALPEEAKHAFFLDLYKRNLKTLSALYESLGIATLGSAEKNAFQEVSAKVIEKYSEMAAFEAQAQFGVSRYSGYEGWLIEGVDPKKGPGLGRLEKHFREYKQALETLYTYAGSVLKDTDRESFEYDKNIALLQAEQAHHCELHDLYSTAGEAAEKKIFNGDEVRRWKDRVAQEEIKLEEIKKALDSLQRGEEVAVR